MVRDAATGELLNDRGGDQHLPPASSQELLTSTVALADLGLDYRFRTSVLADGQLSGGVVAGDLYLRSTGDPTLLASRFDELAALVAGRGVVDVRGGLVADDTWFDAERLGMDWSHQDESFAYPAPSRRSRCPQMRTSIRAAYRSTWHPVRQLAHRPW